ncbi:MAG TPA: sigma 54 modulation/S30EA ribosomal C-terminal domain-containing protein [Acidimicrobiia bacterium]
MEQQLREPTVVVRGDVPELMVDYARDKVVKLIGHASVPVLDAELRLDHHTDPARERPNHVEMTIDLNGTPIRAYRSERTMSEAIDRTLARLRRRMEAAAARPETRRLRHRDPDSWHHGDRPTRRPHVYPRPRDERALVRRKTFALRPESIEEALFDLETLDHDFFLFVHDETSTESVVYRVGDGYGLMQRVATPEAVARIEIPVVLGSQPATATLEHALAILDETDAPFEFFVDERSGVGQVAYRRYDGNYGLIGPS